MGRGLIVSSILSSNVKGSEGQVPYFQCGPEVGRRSPLPLAIIASYLHSTLVFR